MDIEKQRKRDEERTTSIVSKTHSIEEQTDKTDGTDRRKEFNAHVCYVHVSPNGQVCTKAEPHAPRGSGT